MRTSDSLYHRTLSKVKRVGENDIKGRELPTGPSVRHPVCDPYDLVEKEDSDEVTGT